MRGESHRGRCKRDIELVMDLFQFRPFVFFFFRGRAEIIVREYNFWIFSVLMRFNIIT